MDQNVYLYNNDIKIAFSLDISFAKKASVTIGNIIKIF